MLKNLCSFIRVRIHTQIIITKHENGVSFENKGSDHRCTRLQNENEEEEEMKTIYNSRREREKNQEKKCQQYLAL